MSARRTLLLAAALAFSACRGGEEPSAAGRAPDFALKALSGKTVSLKDYSGKVVLLDFWATYCVPCRDSIPAFERLYERWRGRGLEVVGISLDTFTEGVEPFAKELGMGYAVLLDPEHEARRAYGIRGLPTALLIGRDGAVLKRWVGFDPAIKKEIETEVERQFQGS